MLDHKRIFYVEDDAKNRTIVQTILENAHAKVSLDAWGTPEIVVLKIELFKPDLILLDLMYYGRTTGYEIYDWIRRRHSLARTPVAIVSASDPEIEIPIAQAKGLSGYISKPINLSEFPNQVLSLIQGEKVWS